MPWHEKDGDEGEVYVFLVSELLDANQSLEKATLTDAPSWYLTLKSAGGAVKQIKLLGIMGDAYLRTGKNGKEYIVFRGRAGLRPVLVGTRYLRTNPLVRCFVVGGEEILSNARSALRFAFVAYAGLEILNEVTADRPSLARFCVRIASALSKFAAAEYVGAAAGVIAAASGAPVVLAFVTAVIVGFAVGTAIEYLDQKYGITDLAVRRVLGMQDDFRRKVNSAFRAAAGAIVLAHEVAEKFQTVRHIVYRTNRFWRGLTEMQLSLLSER